MHKIYRTKPLMARVIETSFDSAGKVADMSLDSADKFDSEIPKHVHFSVPRRSQSEYETENGYIISLITFFLSAVYLILSVVYLSSYKSSFSQQSPEYGDVIFNTPVFWCFIRDLLCLLVCYCLLIFLLRRILCRRPVL